jgi:hypothetical protein
MKKILFVMLSVCLLTMAGSIPSSAKRIVVTKKVQVDKTCDMRYLVGTSRSNLMSVLGDRYWLWDVGNKVYCHDGQSDHHWVFFYDGSYTISQAEPFHYVGRAFDPEYMEWWLEQDGSQSTGPIEEPYQPTEDDIVIDYGKVYPSFATKLNRVDLGSFSLQLMR